MISADAPACQMAGGRIPGSHPDSFHGLTVGSSMEGQWRSLIHPPPPLTDGTNRNNSERLRCGQKGQWQVWERADRRQGEAVIALLGSGYSTKDREASCRRRGWYGLNISEGRHGSLEGVVKGTHS